MDTFFQDFVDFVTFSSGLTHDFDGWTGFDQKWGVRGHFSLELINETEVGPMILMVGPDLIKSEGSGDTFHWN